jgi:hypothetical protein
MKHLMLVVALTLMMAMPLMAEDDAAPEIRMSDVEHTVLKLGLVPGVSADAAGEAMLSKAVELNMRLVAHLNVGEQVGSRGIESMRLEIFQFCNPEDAVKMARFNTIFAALHAVQHRAGRGRRRPNLVANAEPRYADQRL